MDRKRRIKTLWKWVSDCPPNGEQSFQEVWHVASVGEWEMLRPVLEYELQEGILAPSIILTYFSESVQNQMRNWTDARSPTELSRLKYVGPSPSEGGWTQFFFDFGYPKRWITVRYEAWPEVWGLASARGFPIRVLGAQARGSVQWVKRILRLLGMPVPKLSFSAFSQIDADLLRDEFPGSAVVQLEDPRWDRIAERIESHKQGKSVLLQRHLLRAPGGSERDPEPILILGSVWPRDMQWWADVFAKPIEGLKTVWVIPHQITPEFIRQCEGEFRRIPSATRERIHFRWWNELGILTELYQWGQLAYVGGGRDHGVHSTMEPAYAGIPIACGTYRADRFTEILALERNGQLTRVRSSEELRHWVTSALQVQRQACFLAQAQERQGGAKSHFDWLTESP